MTDYGTRQTDLAVRRAEWRLSRVYRQAQRDIDEKLKDWQKRHEEREAKYRQQLADGKISQADFDAWMRGQVFQDKQWQARKAEIDRILLNADREAQRIVNEGKIGVFADNANYIGYDLERNGNVNTGFTLYDQNTVGRLIKSDPQILPKPAPGVQKDKAYTYYNKLMNSAITQGIVQGETIPQIAKRIIDKTGESSYKSAVRNARTAYTGAQNAGRMEGLHQAQGLGIKVKKQWMATLDSRTRDAHAELDGQIRDVDEPFEVDGMEIDYPGDPTADLSLVYNCRCTLVYVYPDYPSDMQRRDNETGEIVGDMTYREWEAMKQGEGEAPDDDVFTPIELIGGKGNAEITDDIYDYHLPQATRDKLGEIESMSTYNEFKDYLDKKYGIELDTGLDALKGARANDSISAVTEQCQKITTAIDAYRETFGEDALSNLKKVYLYDKDLDVRAAYFFNMVGENDPLAGEIHFRQWGDDGRTIFHELAHAFQDSHKGLGEDCITYSQRIIKDLNAEGLSAYAGASEDAYAAEQFAEAFGFGFSQGTRSGMDFIEKVEEYEYWRRKRGNR